MRAAAACGAVAVLLSALALYGMWAFWPSGVVEGAEAPRRETVHFLGFEPSLTRTRLVFTMVLFAATVGGLPRVLRSLTVSIGCRELRWRAMPGYVLPLLLGIGFALALTGLVDLALASSGRASPFPFAALAVLAGFVAEPAGRALVRAWR